MFLNQYVLQLQPASKESFIKRQHPPDFHLEHQTHPSEVCFDLKSLFNSLWRGTLSEIQYSDPAFRYEAIVENTELWK